MQLKQFALMRAPRDMWLLFAVLGLSVLGLVMVTSASLQIAETRLGSPSYFALRHGIYLTMAIFAGTATYVLVPLALLEKLRHVALMAAFVVLVLVLMPGIGREVNGSQRWISFAGVTVQPSEIAKMAFVIYLAGYIRQWQEPLKQTWGAFMKPLGLLAALTFLLLLEPDFGAVVVLSMTAMGMLFMAGVPSKRYLLVVLVGVVLAGLVAVAQPYRVARLMSFIDPWADQFGSGYQLTQSLIAFGRGHWFGVGLGNSVQKLFYLPEAHTDFVYAVMAEELGLAGNLVLIGLFSFICYRIFKLAVGLLEEGKIFSGQMVLGFGMIIAAQAFINMGVNMGVLPTKGLTLPFVSYGGSSLIICSVMIALVLRAERDESLMTVNKVKRRLP
ncbi:MAG: putative lipid II flippase FtsW [Alcanivoracaceae bacterium]|nr:putative lipid II flippase FtsW [Alcanivoracaceae bacterium]